MNDDNKKIKKGDRVKMNYPVVVGALLLLGVFVFNQFFEISYRHSVMMNEMKIDGQNLSAEEQQAAMSFLKFKKIKSAAIPFGVPEVYGMELDVNYEEVQGSMDKMVGMGPTYGGEDEKIILEGDQLQRFIDIGMLTACEYCCGVTTLVKDDGSAACGCAHSIVMRGLAAYLIKNHSDEMSDEEILAEINNWKKTFFPQQTLTAAFDDLKQAGDEDIDALLQEFPDFLPQMVGGC